MAKKKKKDENSELDEKLMNKSLAGVDNFGEPEEDAVDLTSEEEKRIRLRDRIAQMRKESKSIEPIVVTLAGEAKRASELTREEEDIEFLRCAKDPIYFIETYLTIFDQTQGEGGLIVPFRLFQFQKDLIANYQGNKFNIANKYRQAGASTSTCAYIAWYVMFEENRTVAIVANKLQTARDELMRDVVEFINGCPDYLKIFATKKDTAAHKIYDNNSQLGAFSSKGLRGYTPTLIFWDETAWTEKGDVFWAGTRPSLQTGGRCIMVSTPNGLDAVFYKTFDGAVRKKNNFNATELWWYNDPRYAADLAWVKNKEKENEIRLQDENFTKEKRKQLISDGWEATSPWFERQVADYNGDMRKVAQELLGSFLGSGGNFIPEEILKRCEEDDIKVPIRQEWNDRHMWIWEDPIPGEDYIIAGDVSSGYGDDNSCVQIMKVNEIVEEKIITKHNVSKKIKVRKRMMVQVAEYLGKVTPQNLAEIIYYYGKKYNMAYCVVDVNGWGMGTMESLIGYGYKNIHYSETSKKVERDRLVGYLKTMTKKIGPNEYATVEMIPGFIISNNRGMVLQQMATSIRMKEITLRSIRLINEFKTFVIHDSRTADVKSKAFHDDTILSLAIGMYVGIVEMEKLNSSPEKTKRMIDAMMKISSDEVVVQSHDGNEDEIRKLERRRVDLKAIRNNPYVANAWLLDGLAQKQKRLEWEKQMELEAIERRLKELKRLKNG